MSSTTRKRKFPTPASRTSAPKATPRTSTTSSTSKSTSKSKSQSTSTSKKSKLDDDLLYESESEEESKSRHDEPEEIQADEYEHETADEKRIRLAKQYLTQLGEKTADGEEIDSSDDDRSDAAVLMDPIAHRLQRDIKRQSGTYQKSIAHRIHPQYKSTMKGHQLSVTAVTISDDELSCYSSSKDATIIRWDVATGKKVCIYRHVRGTGTVVDGHTDQVWCLDISSDGHILASGGRDMGVHLWDTRTNQHVYTLKGHRDTITGVAFQKGAQQLFSCSADRTVKIWSVKDRSYIDTLFGHQADVQAIDCLFDEEPVTVGSDRYLRSWKVREEQQLAYNNGHGQSIDCVAMVNQEKFITGGQDGTVCLWSSTRKKPIDTIPSAHGGEWISSVAALPYSDLVATGSSNGQLHLYSTEPKTDIQQQQSSQQPRHRSAPTSKLHLIHSIPVTGFINSIKFARSGKFMCVGVGQEHRMGRWSRIPQAKNGVQIISLLDSQSHHSSNSNNTTTATTSTAISSKVNSTKTNGTH